YVEEEFADRGAGGGEMLLEAIDAVEAVAPEIGGALAFRQLLAVEEFGMHPHHQHFLVMRTVKDADAAALRQRLGRAPQEIVIQFLRAGLLERSYLAALRIDA